MRTNDARVENTVVAMEELGSIFNNTFTRLEDGAYMARLTSYNVVRRSDGQFAIMMNFNVEGHDYSLFRYQMYSHFNRMIVTPVKDFFEHNGIEVTGEQDLLEKMKEIPVPIKFTNLYEGEYDYTFSFQRR